MHFNLSVIGGFAVLVAVIGFFIYKYRTKHNKPLVVSEATRKDAAREAPVSYPAACPCGCGLMWDGAGGPPHYTAAPSKNEADEANEVEEVNPTRP